MSGTSLPVIDLGAVVRGGGGGIEDVARQIHEACTRTGFFYVSGHGVPPAVIDRAQATMRRFFDLPVEQKRLVAVNAVHRGWHEIGGALMYGAAKPDYKEFFGIGLELAEDDPDVLRGQPLRGPNNWPAFMPEVREAFYRYYEDIGACGAHLLRAVAISLGAEPDFFARRYEKRMQRTQAVFYPPQPADLGADQYGVAPHTDYGCITLLWQDAPGLEVRNLDGDWIKAPPLDGTLVVNVGDLLARWSNDRFASTPHRVVNGSGENRLSIATFYDPTYDAVVDPQELGVDAADAGYPPIAAGDYILGRINDSFKYRHESAA